MSRERIGIRQRLSERSVVPPELLHGKLYEPGAKQEAENSAQHGAYAQAGNSPFDHHAQAGEQRNQAG